MNNQNKDIINFGYDLGFSDNPIRRRSSPHTKFYGSAYTARKTKERDHERNQDISLRTKIKDSVFSGLKFQKRLRFFLAIFYILYISITSVIIFWVILHSYPTSVKTILAGTCLANILSILVIMYKFSFEPIKDMISEFTKIGGEHWK